MPTQGAPPLLVPQDHLVDFIDGTIRKEKPEEFVRQEIAKSLVREYAYAKQDIAVEYPIKVGSATKRVDLAIFPEDAERNQQTVWAILECKAPNVSPGDKRDGVGQLKSYMAACVNAEFGLWTNGHERFCFRRVTTASGVDFQDVPDLPEKGGDLEATERPSKPRLKAADSGALLFAFQRCHNYIAGNQGLQKAQAFWELLKLIFAKIVDERHSRELQFYATSQERRSMNGQAKVKKRIETLFAEVIRRFPAIFGRSDVINLEPRVLAYIVAQLQPYSLLASDTDVKGAAYEELVGHNLRGDRGEFFTPRNICRMAVEMLDPGRDELVLDPACGTGGFLVVAMGHMMKKVEKEMRAGWGEAEQLEEWQRQEVQRAMKECADAQIVGIDLNPDLVKACKMNMVMNNDGSGGLFQGNSLAPPVTWSDELQRRNLMGNVDILFANPPFGSKIVVDDPVILRQYDLARVWAYDEASDTFSIPDPDRLQKSQPPEILFIERCVQFLKPGTGVMAVVVPDGILGSPGLAYVREWILQKTRVLASIDLHPDTFQPHVGTQTSLLVLQRKSDELIRMEAAAGRKNDYEVFMALANHIGHDKRGKPTYVRDADGNEVTERRRETVREVHDGREIYREAETIEKVKDDNTLRIAAEFRKWWEAQQ